MLSLEYQEGSLREMAGDGADGHGMALALADAVVDLADVLRLPGGVVPVADDDVGSFDESPLEILIAGLPQVPEAGLTTAGMDGGDDAGIAGELTCGMEAIDEANLPVDDDG